MTFEELEKTVSTFPNDDVGHGATEYEVVAAEQILGVKIPGGFREFLLRFGWGGVSYLELYGLGSDVPAYLDLVRVTKSERTEMVPRLPEYLVPLMNDGGGNLFCLDIRANADEPPVVLWAHDAGESQIPTQIAEDFISWLATQLDEIRTEDST